MIKVKCGSCEGQFNVRSGTAGRRVKCPSCAQVMVVPGSTEKEVEKEENVKQAPISLSALLPTPVEFKPRNYRDLKIARAFLMLIAAIILLLGGISFVISGISLFNEINEFRLLSFLGSTATLTSGAILLAFSELIVVAIDIQENTQKSAYMLSKNE